jgi:AcrR family transcriptional regulator
MSTRPRGRRPGTTDTRAQILDAARDLFAAQGYERASMRAIAARAKVDPSLIVHYFASKEGLLREALTLPIDPRAVLASGLAEVPDEQVGEELVRVVLGVWEQPAVRSRLLSLLRTAVSHDLAMAVLRQMLQRTVVAAVARLVDDDSAQMRAELVATQMAGLAMARYLVQLPSVASASVDYLAVAIGPSVQRYLTEEI